MSKLRRVYVTFAEGDLLDATDLDALPLLDCLHECRRVHQRLEGACVQPGSAPVENRDVQGAAL